MSALFRKIAQWDSHHRLIAALAATALVVLLTAGHLRLPVEIVTAWNTFSCSVVFLAWLRILSEKPATFWDNAKLQDSSRTTIFLFVIIAALISVFAVWYLLGSAKELGKAGVLRHVLLSIVTIVGSWSLIHTMFTLRYAHFYYGDADEADPSAETTHVGGLDFPSEPNPDYLDFAYFSFIIGMTCQVSDVQITDRNLRRLALIHGLLTFAFNTVILALSINVVSGLL